MGYSSENLEYVTLCLWHFIASFKFIQQYREVNKSKKGDVVQEAINYMRSNLDKRLSLEDIAGNVNYSPSHFGQIFLKKNRTQSVELFQPTEDTEGMPDA